jgi:hypothetical protein
MYLRSTVVVTVGLLMSAFGAQAGTVLADSVADFSGVQGQSSWYYGYYTSPFDWSTFSQLSFTTGAWVNSPGWTYIGSDVVHPNGPNTFPGEQWAVRRWVSEVSGTVDIDGHFAANNPGMAGADGVTFLLMLNPTTLLSRSIASGDTVGQDFHLTAAVRHGDTLDFVVAPGANDWRDGTAFNATVSLHTPEPDTLGILAVGWCAIWFRWKKQRR